MHAAMQAAPAASMLSYLLELIGDVQLVGVEQLHTAAGLSWMLDFEGQGLSLGAVYGDHAIPALEC